MAAPLSPSFLALLSLEVVYELERMDYADGKTFPYCLAKSSEKLSDQLLVSSPSTWECLARQELSVGLPVWTESISTSSSLFKINSRGSTTSRPSLKNIPRRPSHLTVGGCRSTDPTPRCLTSPLLPNALSLHLLLQRTPLSLSHNPERDRQRQFMHPSRTPYKRSAILLR